MTTPPGEQGDDETRPSPPVLWGRAEGHRVPERVIRAMPRGRNAIPERV